MLSSMCHHAEKYHTSGISEIMYAYVDGNKIPVNPVQKFNLIFIVWMMALSVTLSVTPPLHHYNRTIRY